MQLTVRVVAVAIALSTLGLPALAQQSRTAAKPGPWFGVTLPPPPGEEPAVIVGDRAPRPVIVPAGEAPSPELPARPSAPTSRRSSASRKRAGRRGDRQPDSCGGASPASRPAPRRSTGPSISSARPASPTCKRAADHAGPRARVLAAAVVGSASARRSGVRAGSTDVVLESAMPLSPSEHSRRHADGAARVRRQRRARRCSSTST